MGLSDTLYSLRKACGFTLLDVANRVGVSEATVQRWESGNIKNIKYDNILKLSSALNVSPVVLMGWDVVEPPELTPLEHQVLVAFRQLNREGQEKLQDYADDLVASGRYIKASSSRLVDKA